MEKILALDTSTNSTGWAYFEGGKYMVSGVISMKEQKDVDIRMANMVSEIYRLIDCYSPTNVVTEMTVVVRNPAVQRMLTMILGAVYGKCVSNKIEYKSLRPTEWRKLVDPGKKPKKRNELKEWSKQKVNEFYKLDNINDDVSDAILLGLAFVNSLGGE